MIGRTNTGGGGGGGLNFKVVGGTTAPSNPKENMIWINTSTTITDWVFSATQPTAATGRVWISIGTESAVEFNALKKNGIQVYPISAKQYVSSAWVNKVAKIFQNGKWSYFAVAPTDGLIAEYTFDKFSGNAITDTSPNGYNLTATNVTQSNGVVEKAGYFAGNSKAVANVRVIPNGMSGFNGLTVSFWIKTTIKPESSAYILTQYNDYNGFTVSINSSGFVYATLNNGSNVATLSGYVVNDGNWHNVCLVFNYTTGKLQAWFDGVKLSNTWNCSKFTNSNANLTIGYHGTGISGYGLIGSLDQVRLYNRALSDAEVTTLWNGGVGC